MGIVSFSNIPVLSTLLTRLRTQLGLFDTDASASDIASFKEVKKSRPRKLVLVTGQHICQASKKDLFADSQINFPLKRPTVQLKIVRQFEPDIGPLCAGRMTISGSMADVCAEIDRMVERETLRACFKSPRANGDTHCSE